MRSLSWLVLAAVPAGAALSAAGCNQISGVSGYERSSEVAQPLCATHAECADAFGDNAYVCRKTDGRCVQLTSDDCPYADGFDPANGPLSDDAFVFASILPTTLSGGRPGPGGPLLNAMSLALAEIRGYANGLPPRLGSTTYRPFVMLACNDAGNLETSKRAATHAVAEVGLPAVLGPMFSGITVQVATDVTIAAKAFLLSPTAAVSSLTTLDDDGLVWRTAPTAELQSRALASFTRELEADAATRAALQLAEGQKMSVAVVLKGDAFGSDLARGLGTYLKFNGAEATSPANADYYFEHDYGNPDNPAAPPPTYDATAERVIAERPHVIYLLGVEEINAEMLPRIERGWSAPHRPLYLSASGPYTQGLFSYVQQNDQATGIRKRILGVVPGTNNQTFRNFRSKYGGRYDIAEADTSGPAQSYDAVYLLAYSLVALGDGEITGAGIAEGMKRTVPLAGGAATPIEAGSADDLNKAFAELAAGRNIDFNGASGPVDFDIATGDPNSDMQVWCVGAEYKGKNSDTYYDAEGALVGSVSAFRTSCGLSAP